MNFFLDSTIFQDGKDVFLNNKLSREFLNICRQQNFSIFISTVVIDEIRRQYKTFMNSQLQNIRAGVGAINVIPRFNTIHLTIPHIEEVMSAFDIYFRELQEEGILQIVPYSNDFLPELVHRSIHRIKPFTEAKQEFRDAIIWFSYAEIAEEQQLENCFLISGNTTDYLNKEGQLHEELVEKSNRFLLFKDMYALLNSPIMEPFKATHALLSSLKQKEWDIDAILNFLNDHNTRDYILKHLDDDSTKELLKETLYIKEKISGLVISNITRPSIRGIDYINREFIISGNFQVQVQFLASRESENPSLKAPKIGLEEIMIFFDAVYDPDSETFKNLEISSFENAYEYWEGVSRVSQDRY